MALVGSQPAANTRFTNTKDSDRKFLIINIIFLFDYWPWRYYWDLSRCFYIQREEKVKVNDIQRFGKNLWTEKKLLSKSFHYFRLEGSKNEEKDYRRSGEAWTFVGQRIRHWWFQAFRGGHTFHRCHPGVWGWTSMLGPFMFIWFDRLIFLSLRFDRLIFQVKTHKAVLGSCSKFFK